MKDGNNHFETKVLQHLDELKQTVTKIDTKMDMVISDDASTGMVPRLQEDVKALEKRAWYFGGAALGIGGFIHYLVDTLKITKGH